MKTSTGITTSHAGGRQEEAPGWREGELENCYACPACGGQAVQSLHAGVSDRTFRSAPGTWTIWRCEECGTGYLNPRPTAAAITRAYESYYTHSDTPEWWMREQGTRFRRLAMRLVNGRMNARLGYDRQPALRAGAAVLPLLVRRDRELLGHLRYLHARPGGRVLDIGCGDGAFLALLRELGWTTTVGIDPDPKAVRRAEAARLDVRLGTWQEVSLEAASFDAITLNHSIEHVHDPIGLLKACRQWLAPGGELIIYTPNLDSNGHRLFGRDWFHLDPPRHLVIFTPSSLRRALEETGFRQVTQLPPRLRGACVPESSALRSGGDPLRPPPLTPQMRFAGVLANLRTLINPDRAEEVALRATL